MKPSVRFRVFQRDKFTCRYCGLASPEAILEVDHVLALTNGGTDDEDNLVTSCYECNRGKGARLLTDVPPESDAHEKAILIAEHERQVAELYHWREKQRERERREVGSLKKWWRRALPRADWNDSSVKAFLRKLDFYTVAEIMESVAGRVGNGINQAGSFRYFCGACWNHINKVRDAESDHP